MYKKAKVKKEYLAICHGDPGFDTVVDAPLYRRSSGKVGAVDKMDAEKFGAKAANTRVRNVATAAGGWEWSRPCIRYTPCTSPERTPLEFQVIRSTKRGCGSTGKRG